jgi:hypothetical protein
MSLPIVELQDGEVVTLTITGARYIGTFLNGPPPETARFAVGEFRRIVFVPTDVPDAVTIVRSEPAEGIPKPGEIWAASNGEPLWVHQYDNKIWLMDSLGRKWEWSWLHAHPEHGPLRRLWRPLVAAEDKANLTSGHVYVEPPWLAEAVDKLAGEAEELRAQMAADNINNAFRARWGTDAGRSPVDLAAGIGFVIVVPSYDEDDQARRERHVGTFLPMFAGRFDPVTARASVTAAKLIKVTPRGALTVLEFLGEIEAIDRFADGAPLDFDWPAGTDRIEVIPRPVPNLRTMPDAPDLGAIEVDTSPQGPFGAQGHFAQREAQIRERWAATHVVYPPFETAPMIVDLATAEED